MTAFASINAGIAGLMFFFIFFVALALWLIRPQAKKNAAAHARIPLQEDENNG